MTQNQSLRKPRGFAGDGTAPPPARTGAIRLPRIGLQATLAPCYGPSMTLPAGTMDAQAMLAQGLRLLADPATNAQGTRLIVDAAHAGNAEALHLVALMAAVDDTLGAERWGYALAYLGRAAIAGHGLARKTLAFLAGDAAVTEALANGATFDDETWRRLHDAITPATWLETPVLAKLSAAPAIASAPGLFSPAMCDWIIARARPHLKRAQVYDPGEGAGRTALERTNSEMRFEFPALDLVLLLAFHRIAKISGFAFKGWEPASVLHYLPGQEFRRHYDYLDPAIPAYAAEIAGHGQRLATMLVYLSEDFSGGETDFPLAGIRFKGRRGDAVLFHNVTRAGEPDPATLHAGLAPVHGEKWLLSQWIRGRVLPPGALWAA